MINITGATANKAAIGARVAITVVENGKERLIHRTVSSGASFGANSLALEVGLRKATDIKSVRVQWPCKDCPDSVFGGLEINKSFRLVQGATVAQPQDYMQVGAGGKAGHSTHSH